MWNGSNPACRVQIEFNIQPDVNLFLSSLLKCAIVLFLTLSFFHLLQIFIAEPDSPSCGVLRNHHSVPLYVPTDPYFENGCDFFPLSCSFPSVFFPSSPNIPFFLSFVLSSQIRWPRKWAIVQDPLWNGLCNWMVFLPSLTPLEIKPFNCRRMEWTRRELYCKLS